MEILFGQDCVAVGRKIYKKKKRIFTWFVRLSQLSGHGTRLPVTKKTLHVSGLKGSTTRSLQTHT